MKKLEILRRFRSLGRNTTSFSLTTPEEFRVKTSIRRQLANSKRRIERRLDKSDLRGCSGPMMTARNIHYEIGERARGIAAGGLGAMHLLVRRLGLAEAIDRRLEVLKIHLPYHESDHVLALAYLPLCGGTCLQDLELLRNDEVLLDALGARRIPDPTTAGAFCRTRFTPSSTSSTRPASASGLASRQPSSSRRASTWMAFSWKPPASA